MLFRSSFEKLIYSSLEWLECPWIRWPLMIILFLYIILDIPMIESWVDRILQNRAVLAIVLILIIYISHKDVALSSLLLVALLFAWMRRKESFVSYGTDFMKQINAVQTAHPTNDIYPPESAKLNMGSEAYNDYGKIVPKPFIPTETSEKEEEKVSETMQNFETQLHQQSMEETRQNNEPNAAMATNLENFASYEPMTFSSDKMHQLQTLSHKKQMETASGTKDESFSNQTIVPFIGYNIPEDGSIPSNNKLLDVGIATMNPQSGAQSLTSPSGVYTYPVYAPY